MKRATLLLLLTLSLPAYGLSGFIKQGASGTLKFGPMYDKTDGVTPEAGLTLHANHIELSKNGGAFTVKTSAGALTYDKDGYYNVPFDATDSGTGGILTVKWYDPNAVCVPQEYVVLSAVAYESMCGSGAIPANVTQWASANVATPDTAGYPKVTVKNGTGAGELSIAAGAVNSDVRAWNGSAQTLANFSNVFYTDYATAFNEPNGVWNNRTVAISKAAGVATINDVQAEAEQAIDAKKDAIADKVWVNEPNSARLADIASIKTTADKVATAMEADGGVWRFTTNALEQSPAPSGAVDWTVAERQQIRSALGVAGDKTTAADGQLQAVKVTTDKLDTSMELDGAVYRYTTNALEQSPAAAAATDWTAGEKENIRHALGVAGTKTAGAGGLIQDVNTVTGKVNDMLELDGSIYRYTANALEQSPAVAAATDWTTAEKQQLRDALGVTGDKTTAAGGQLQTMKTVSDKVDTALELDGAVYRLTANSLELGPMGATDWTAGEKENIRSALGVAGTKTTASGGQLQTVQTTTNKLDTSMELDGAVYRYTTNALEQSPAAAAATDWTTAEKENIRSALGVAGTKTAGAGGLIQDVNTVTEKLNTALELDGTVYRYTTNALEQSPAAAAATDWTAGEKENIRSALGVTGTKTAGAGGLIQDVNTVIDKMNTALELDGSVYRLTTNALEQAPVPATLDWTDNEKQQMRQALGIDGTKASASGGHLQTIKTATDKVNTMVEADGGTYRFTTNAVELSPSSTGGGWTPLRKNTAQGGTATTVTLDTGASATNDIYRGNRVVIYGGTGAGQSGIIDTYNGSTKQATMLWSWVTVPASDSLFEIQAADGELLRKLGGLWQ